MDYVEKVKLDIVSQYQEKTRKSKKLLEIARKYIPGGDTRTAAYFGPYPFFGDYGKGFSLYDVDGNKYTDFVNNFTTLIHGHAFGPVVEAVKRQAELGLVHGTPIESQYKLAKILIDRVSGVETVRFSNSATEATLFAMRAARAFNGRSAFIRMDGGYNGCHDFAEVNITPDYKAEGMPRSIPERGIPASVADETFVVPFNDLNATEQILKEHSHKIAGIIMEPVLGAGGAVLPEEGYLKGMRDLADKYDVILIFDETISFRLHEGGLQGMYGVNADLTTFGKIIGGGAPVGAFGGRRDIMDVFNVSTPNFVVHSGTFSGNALTMAAGIANMEHYGKKEIERINRLGDLLKDGIQKAANRSGVPVQVHGFGSLVSPMYSERKMRNAKEVALYTSKSRELQTYIHLEMLNRGISFLERGLFVISTPMNESLIEDAVKNYGETLEMLKPVAEQIFNGKGV